MPVIHRFCHGERQQESEHYSQSSSLKGFHSFPVHRPNPSHKKIQLLGILHNFSQLRSFAMLAEKIRNLVVVINDKAMKAT